RTTCPLTTLRNAYGRCGEESVLGVAAFRSVGIPARQAYTPRWAHCDDNHAWVEVWTDGEWHFLGACEPEATLDSGWFQLSASRGMLIQSKVFATTVENELITRQT
ncbi:MAG: transglutaminase-like domain-containing protein, partial [Niameybacter sp.]